MLYLQTTFSYCLGVVFFISCLGCVRERTDVSNNLGQCGCIDVRKGGAIGDGGGHTIEEVYGSLDSAVLVFPEVANILKLQDQVDWAAIQNSLYREENSSKICIPAGVYFLNRRLNVRSNTSIGGDGDMTIVKRIENADNIGVRQIFFGLGVSNVVIENLSIDFNKLQVLESDTTGKIFPDGIAFQRRCEVLDSESNECLEYGTFDNITIRGIKVFDSAQGENSDICCPHGILVRYGKNILISRNRLYNGFRIKAGGVGGNVEVSNNVIVGGNDNAITIATADSGKDIITTEYLISENHIYSTVTGSSIFVGADGDSHVRKDSRSEYSKIIIKDNYIEGPASGESRGIMIRPTNFTNQIHVTGNILESNNNPSENNTQGIFVKGSRFSNKNLDILVSDNSIIGNYNTSSIWINATNNVRIVDNQISNNFENEGIRLSAVQNVVVSNNIIDSCKIGLYLYAAQTKPITGTIIDAIINGNIISNSKTHCFLANTDIETDNIIATLSHNKIIGNSEFAITEIEPTLGTMNIRYFFNDLRRFSGRLILDINDSEKGEGNLLSN